jgi:hypothetical protein
VPQRAGEELPQIQVRFRHSLGLNPFCFWLLSVGA